VVEEAAVLAEEDSAAEVEDLPVVVELVEDGRRGQGDRYLVPVLCPFRNFIHAKGYGAPTIAFSLFLRSK
jgi:hypothetical protein